MPHFHHIKPVIPPTDMIEISPARFVNKEEARRMQRNPADRASLALLAALLLVPGFVWAGQQPTATEIFNLRERCAAQRNAIQDGYNEEIKKQKPIPDIELDSRYASNYNNITNRCYILHEHTLKSIPSWARRKIALGAAKQANFLVFARLSDERYADCLLPYWA